ncbi:unnamed protein product [Lupinus luteus]|uniref:Uncharacterized protein n=1 Tax=Lupinus luteus TaxID=3873 RepID=A0AAV1WUB9_LUPLU
MVTGGFIGNVESEKIREVGFKELENGTNDEINGLVQVIKENEGLKSIEESLLGTGENSKLRILGSNWGS